VPPTRQGLARAGIDVIDLGGAYDACGVYSGMAGVEGSPRLSNDPNDEWRKLAADGTALLYKVKDLGEAAGGEDNVVHKASGSSPVCGFARRSAPLRMGRGVAAPPGRGLRMPAARRADGALPPPPPPRSRPTCC
jgi:hypothetical protein